MRLFAVLSALLLLTHPWARADAAAEALLDRAGFSRLEVLSESVEGVDARAIAEAVLSGKLEPDRELAASIRDRFTSALREALLSALLALAAPVLVTLGLKMALDGGAGALTLLCRLACVCVLARHCASAAEVAESALRTSARIADGAAPVIAAALTLTGRGATATALTPLSALGVDAIGNIFIRLGLPLCSVAAVVAAGGSLSDRFRLDRLFRLICRVIVWGVRLLIAGFVGLLALEGRLAAAGDATSWQALRQALRGLVPVIGGSLSDSSGALMASAMAARNAVGVTGMLIVLGAGVGPVLRLAAHMLSMKLASAVIEPVADPGIARIAACYGEIAKLLLALCVGGMMLAMLLAGACFAIVGT